MATKLNGWVRLWIVLSGIWLMVVGVRAYSDLSALLEKKDWEVAKEGVGKATFVFSNL
jgi:hypothetical protein